MPLSYLLYAFRTQGLHPIDRLPASTPGTVISAMLQINKYIQRSLHGPMMLRASNALQREPVLSSSLSPPLHFMALESRDRYRPTRNFGGGS